MNDGEQGHLSWDSSVHIVVGYGLAGPESIPSKERFFSSPQRADWLWGSPSLLSNGYRGAFSLGVKRLGFEADHSFPSTGGGEWWSYTSTPPYVLMA
jgi:hypothetical protein